MFFQEPESQNLDLSDDEELAQAMDFHSMIINSHHHDPEHVVTADEVISELETMMEVSTYWLYKYSMTPVSKAGGISFLAPMCTCSILLRLAMTYELLNSRFYVCLTQFSR